MAGLLDYLEALGETGAMLGTGAGSGATGVTSPIGAGKLELLAQQIGKTAQRLNVSPETARDMIIRGQTHAGYIDPKLAAALGLTVGGGLLADQYYGQ